MNKHFRRGLGAMCAGAVAAGVAVVAAGTAQANPADCFTLPMGVAGLALCPGPGEHRIVLECVDMFFPTPFSSSHRYTTMIVEGPWMTPGIPSFATCLGEGGMLPITSHLWTETMR